MLKAIIYREFLNNIINLRFTVGVVLCVIITIASVKILTDDYQREHKDYQLRLNLQEESLEEYAHLNRLIGLVTAQKPPEEFRPLIIGISREAHIGSFYDNPLSVLFPHLDFLFIVTIIMSLLAILFSYDAITGERQNGTLRLVIANSISRAKVLVAKWIGGSASLLIPFVLSLLSGAIYISVSPAISWDAWVWSEFAILAVGSITFISIFYLLGLTVSAFSRYSSASVLTCLFLWVLLILVIPNVSPYIAAQLFRIPSVNKIEKEYDYITSEERDEVMRLEMAKVKDKFEVQYGDQFREFKALNFGGIYGYIDAKDKQAIQKRVTSDPQFKAMMDAFRAEWEQLIYEVNRNQMEKGDKLKKYLKKKASAQTKFAKDLACISPLANFTYFATDLTGTGMRSFKHFERLEEIYEELFLSYIMTKLQEQTAKNPAFNIESYVDVSDRPRFVFKEESLRGKLNAVLPYWGILVLFNVIFFASAFARFMIYDVR